MLDNTFGLLGFSYAVVGRQSNLMLGLRLVNMLTRQLKGTIELDRSGGTTFKITFARPKR